MGWRAFRVGTSRKGQSSEPVDTDATVSTAHRNVTSTRRALQEIDEHSMTPLFKQYH